jgi:hypothetical protein
MPFRDFATPMLAFAAVVRAEFGLEDGHVRGRESTV